MPNKTKENLESRVYQSSIEISSSLGTSYLGIKIRYEYIQTKKRRGTT